MADKDVNQKVADVLAEADRRKAIRKAMTFNAYSIRVEGGYTLPFYSRDDRAAMTAYKGMVKEAGIPRSDLMLVGYYHADTAKFLSIKPKLITE